LYERWNSTRNSQNFVEQSVEFAKILWDRGSKIFADDLQATPKSKDSGAKRYLTKIETDYLLSVGRKRYLGKKFAGNLQMEFGGKFYYPYNLLQSTSCNLQQQHQSSSPIDTI